MNMRPKRQGINLSQEKKSSNRNFIPKVSACTKTSEELSTHLVVPDLHQAVICPRNEVWLVPTTVVVNAVHSFLMAFQGEIGRGWSKLPHLTSKTQPLVPSNLLCPGHPWHTQQVSRSTSQVQREVTQNSKHNCFLRWKTSTTAQQSLPQ